MKLEKILEKQIDTAFIKRDIDKAIAEHEARVTQSGLWLALMHDLLIIGIVYLIIKVF